MCGKNYIYRRFAGCKGNHLQLACFKLYGTGRADGPKAADIGNKMPAGLKNVPLN